MREDFKANYLINISLYEDLERVIVVQKRETEERLSSVFLSLVLCFVLRALFEQTDIIKEVFVERICVGEKPSILSRYAFCSVVVYWVSLLRSHIHLKRERARVLLFFSFLGFRFSLSLFVLLSFFSS